MGIAQTHTFVLAHPITRPTVTHSLSRPAAVTSFEDRGLAKEYVCDRREAQNAEGEVILMSHCRVFEPSTAEDAEDQCAVRW